MNEKGKARMVVGPKGNIWSCSGKDFAHEERNLQAEWGIMVSALRRLHLRGVLPMIYENPFVDKEQMQKYKEVLHAVR